jgi:deoxyribonuclease-4
MNKLLFGTAGKPHRVEDGSTAKAVQYVHELGLGCMELEFVRGVQMGEQKAAAVAETARSLNIKLSAHAPYFINLNAEDQEKIRASQERIIHSARIASICGAETVVVHLAYFMKDTPEEAYPKIKRRLEETLEVIRQMRLDVTIRPEVMGKASQFGNVDEVIRICSETEGTAPCIDFAHIHAATGAFNSYEEFASILDKLETGLGREALDTIHAHCSGIKYGPKGEQKHLDMAESDFNYRDLMKVLKDYYVKGLLIC